MKLLGDIHGSYTNLEFHIKYGSSKSIMQVGDFGLGFKLPSQDGEDMKYLSDLLEFHDKYLYVIRGNHDDPKYWNGEYADKWRRIMLIPDYSVVEIDSLNVLCIGGALSIDRKVRRVGKDYWREEVVKEDWERLDKCLEMKIDMVVTHTTPSFAWPQAFNDLVYSYSQLDTKLLNQLTAERELMTRIWNKIKEKNNPTHYIYGHFHMDAEEEYDGTKFICLGVGMATEVN